MEQHKINPLRKLTLRFILAAMEMMLGVSVLFHAYTIGSSFAFLEQHWPFVPLWFIGLSFLVSGALLSTTRNGYVYLFAVSFLLFIGLLALIGALFNEVSLQSAIVYIGLFIIGVYAFWGNGHGH